MVEALQQVGESRALEPEVRGSRAGCDLRDLGKATWPLCRLFLMSEMEQAEAAGRTNEGYV